MTAPSTTPPLEEREAVARIVEWSLSQTAWPFAYRIERTAAAIIAKHIAPLRTENETLRAELDAAIARAEEAGKATDRVRQAMIAKFDTATRLAAERYHQISTLRAELAQAKAQVAGMRKALEMAEGPLSWLARDLHGSAVVARALAAVRAVLTNPEHPHGD